MHLPIDIFINLKLIAFMVCKTSLVCLIRKLVFFATGYMTLILLFDNLI